jgi:hypothetical protein
VKGNCRSAVLPLMGEEQRMGRERGCGESMMYECVEMSDLEIHQFIFNMSNNYKKL